MTTEEFDKTRFTWNMRCIYKSKEYPINSVDFRERLVAIYEDIDNDTPDWKRCENIELIK